MPLNEPWKVELEDQGDPGDEQRPLYRLVSIADIDKPDPPDLSVWAERPVFGSTIGADTRRLIEQSVVATELQEE